MDILDAIAESMAAFQQAGLEPSTAMLLGSYDEGIRFLSALRQQVNWSCVVGDPGLGHAVEMVDGSTWMEMKVMGVAIRWPADGPRIHR